MRCFSLWLLAADPVSAAPPPLAGTLLWSLVAIVGVILWLFGRRLAKPACAIAGLVIGLAVGWLIAELAQAGQSLPIYLIAGSLIGGGVCLLLFRIWMGIGLALILTFTLTPILLPLFLPGSPDPRPVPPQERNHELVQSSGVINTAHWARLKKIIRATTDDSLASHRSSDWGDRLMPMIRRQAEIWRHRFSLPATSPTRWRHPTAITAGVALAGLLVGLLMPKFAATVQSAWAGSWMMLTAFVELLAAQLPRFDLSWLHTADHWLMALGLITIIGIILQCSIGRRKTDQKEKAAAGT